MLAAAGYVVVVASLAHAAGGPSSLWVRLSLVAVAAAPMAVRRRWPVPAFAVAVTAAVASVALGALRDPLLAPAFTVYAVALDQPRRRWIPTAAVGVLSIVGLMAMTMGSTVPPAARHSPPADEQGLLTVLGLALMGGSWTVGRAVRDRRAFAARSARALADRAVAAERLRIARELHDVVTNSMGVITVKAGVANHVIRERPEEAHEALRDIEATGRRALAEMRHLLGVLRDDGPAPPHAGPPGSLSGGSLSGSTVSLDSVPARSVSVGSAPGASAAVGVYLADTEPAPGLSGLPELARRAAMAGVSVDLSVPDTEVPEGVGLSVYRIVQEALTNVIRHAAPATCRVTVTVIAGTVRVEVADDGPGVRTLSPGPDDGGHGLVGMRERVAAYGGVFTAGPRPAGGFGVVATLPYES